jgi:hypothetical protein
MTHAMVTEVRCDVAPNDLTIEQAHVVMQTHLRCHTGSCTTRRTALELLVRHGRYLLADRSSAGRRDPFRPA